MPYFPLVGCCYVTNTTAFRASQLWAAASAERLLSMVTLRQSASHSSVLGGLQYSGIVSWLGKQGQLEDFRFSGHPAQFKKRSKIAISRACRNIQRRILESIWPEPIAHKNAVTKGRGSSARPFLPISRPAWQTA